VSAADLPQEFLLGSYVPLVTPFHDDDTVDEETYAGLVEAQIAGGSAGIVVTGTSGEPSTLTTEERTRLVEVAVAASAGRLPVVAATGGQSLRETLELTRRAEKAGASAVLVVTPYYIKPPQRGLIAYFAAVAQATTLPVLIYHIPGRAAVSMPVDSVAAVVDRAPNVVGLKHAVDDLGYATELLARLGRDFRLFAGVEQLSFPILAIGGSGLMNAVGNLAPGPVAQLCHAVEQGRLADARELHYRLLELNQAVFWDTNPIPIKYLMWRSGLLPADTHRLPMSPPGTELQARLDGLLERARAAGLLERGGHDGSRGAEAGSSATITA
jgi:4-hydroxy-tetrahydrodipicolinate synthase